VGFEPVVVDEGQRPESGEAAGESASQGCCSKRATGAAE
jgi:hypothetical protein